MATLLDKYYNPQTPTIPTGNTPTVPGTVASTQYNAPAVLPTNPANYNQYATPQTVPKMDVNTPIDASHIVKSSNVSTSSFPEIQNNTPAYNAALAGSLSLINPNAPAGFQDNPVPSPVTAPAITETQKKIADLAGIPLPEPKSAVDQSNELQQAYGLAAKQQTVNDLTAQLNAISARTQAAEISQGIAGQTQGLVGGRVAEIRRQAAIEALPISAQLAAAQGNLQTAQSQITTLMGLQKQDADAQYQYRKDQRDYVMQIFSATEKKQLQEQQRQDDLKQAEQKTLESQKNAAIAEAYRNNDYVAASKIALAKTPEELAAAQQGIKQLATGAGSNKLLSVTEATALGVPYGTTEAQAIALGLQPHKALTSAQQDDLATMNTVVDLGNQALTLGGTEFKGTGGLGYGTIAQYLAKNFGAGTKEGQDLRNLIGNIQGTIAKLRGGTSFTPNEQALLETYVPTINDSPLVIQSKIGSLNSFIQTKKGYLLGTNDSSKTLPIGSTGKTASGLTFTIEQ